VLPDNDQRGVVRPQGLECDTGSVELQGRPDALVRQGTAAFVGNNVYNTNGQGQAVDVSVRRRQSVTVTLRSQNDGERSDELRVQGPATDGKFTLLYLRGRADVTAQVVAGTYQGSLAPGATDTLTLTMTAKTNTAVGAIRNLVITTTSVASPTVKDAVGVTVRVT
jgi:hypothetical protein